MLSETLYIHFVKETCKFANSMQFNEYKWSHEGPKGLIVDVGCGINHISTNFIRSRYANVDQIYSIDNDPEVIRFFNRYNEPKLLEIKEADITDWDFLMNKEGKVSKVVSLRCLDEVQDQKKAFENIFRLLKRGGDMLVLMTINSTFYELVDTVLRRDRWRKYFKGRYVIPESHTSRFTADYYRSLLHFIGFVEITVSDMPRIVIYKKVTDFKEDVHHWSSCSSIPEECRQEFAEEVLSESVRLGKIRLENFCILYNTLWIHAGKPL
ncbi:juvenile hormone acid O-methyltransferase-like [Argiope bruennichi]|uniref:juvenile hormone acid O-methyltransferase-like n=1 Tax=Argiope bruennichi TaxID=94029 RepID=UPI00249566FD|nr:juvenile hormone acid O-methyltransferase-like [Argiope bruennichi]